MGQKQSSLQHWVDTVTTEDIHPQLVHNFMRGNGEFGSYTHLTPSDVAWLRTTFKIHRTSEKTWDETSFASCFQRSFTPANMSLATASALLFRIATFHAAYPFHIIPTPNLGLSFSDFVRVVVLLSHSRRRLHQLDGMFFTSEDRPGLKGTLILNTGRSEIDRRRLLFLSLAERKPNYVFPREQESLLAPPGHKEKAATQPIEGGLPTGYWRNQYCNPRDIDVLDVLQAIQPMGNWFNGRAISMVCNNGLKAVSRHALRGAAERMPRGVLPEEMWMPWEGVKDLVKFVCSFEVGGDGSMKNAVTIQDEEIEALLGQFEGAGNGKVEWNVFNAVVEKEEKKFEALWKVFDRLLGNKWEALTV